MDTGRFGAGWFEYAPRLRIGLHVRKDGTGFEIGLAEISPQIFAASRPKKLKHAGAEQGGRFAAIARVADVLVDELVVDDGSA